MSVICTECQPIYLAWMQFFSPHFFPHICLRFCRFIPEKILSRQKKCKSFSPKRHTKKSQTFHSSSMVIQYPEIHNNFNSIFERCTIFDGNFIWRHLEEEKKLPPCFCFSILLVWSWSFQTSVRKNWLLRFDLTKKRCCFSDKESNAFELISQKYSVKDDI